jgi:hypothetical protein
MATWTDTNNKVWTFDDGKLDFTAWINESAERTTEWNLAVAEYIKDQNGPKAGVIFGQWTAYANADIRRD